MDKGDFSEKILTISNPQKLYLIDKWGTKRYSNEKRNFVEKRFLKEIREGKVIIITGNAVDELKKIENNFLDWIYIDTSHIYEETLKELKMSELKIKKNGIISGHDYCVGNVKKGCEYGVIQAVNEFCIENNWELIFLTHESHGFLSFAIRKIKA